MKTSFRFLFVALGFLVLMGCSWFLPEPEPDARYPDLKVFAGLTASQALPSGTTYDFGDVTVEESSTAHFTLKNEGESDLHLEETGSIVIIIRSVSENPFTVAASALVIPAGGSVPFSVTFAPRAVGAFSTVVTISSDDPDGAYELTVTGEGVAEPEPEPEPWMLPNAYRIVSLDTDPEGNVYVHGAYLASDLFYFTTKFDASGAILWSRVEDGIAVFNMEGVPKYAPILYHDGYLYEVVEEWETYSNVQKLSASSGNVVWRQDGGSSGFVEEVDSFHSYPGVSQLDYDGNTLASLNTKSFHVRRMVGDGTYLYMSGYDVYYEEYLVARHSYDLDAGDWMLLWPIGSTELRPVGYPLPLAVAQGTPFGDILYVAGKRSDTDEPAIFAYGDLGTVEDGWCVTVGTNASEVPMSAVADAQGAVYLVSRDGMTIYVTNVQPVSATSGEIAWRTSYDVSYPDTHIATEPGLVLSPDGDVLYVVDGTNMVKRFNPADGDEFN